MSLFELLGIGTAMAATTPAGHAQEGGLMSVLPMLIVFALIFYFLLIRPQSKRQKEHRKLLAELAKGDEVLTSGGLVGRISKMNDDFVVVAPCEGVELTLQKSAIVSVLPKGTLKSL